MKKKHIYQLVTTGTWYKRAGLGASWKISFLVTEQPQSLTYLWNQVVRPEELVFMGKWKFTSVYKSRGLSWPLWFSLLLFISSSFYLPVFGGYRKLTFHLVCLCISSEESYSLNITQWKEAQLWALLAQLTEGWQAWNQSLLPLECSCAAQETQQHVVVL